LVVLETVPLKVNFKEIIIHRLKNVVIYTIMELNFACFSLLGVITGITQYVKQQNFLVYKFTH
jgi:hypothetical protein